MVRFLCKECGYGFEPRFGKPNKCPYCGKESVEEEKDADEIVKEVEDILE